MGLLPLFVLYLQQHHGLTEYAAVLTFGIFQSLSYLGALPAGAIADRALGPAATTLLGGALLTLGYGALALDRPALLWPALGLMVLGHGFFKSGINALASARSGVNDIHHERAFLLLHVAVNIGAMTGPLCAEWARARAGWAGVYYVATSGMMLSTFLLAFGWSQWPGRSAPKRPLAAAEGLPGDERERIRAVRLLCGIALIFWLTAQQAGTSLPMFAEEHTVQHLRMGARIVTLGPGHFAALHSLLVLLLVPLLLWGSALLRRHRAEPSTPVKMIWGYGVTAAAFLVMGGACLAGEERSRVSVGWLSTCYLLLSAAEVLLAPLGLSLVTRLTPAHRLSQTVGLWFGSVALGSGMAGVFALLWGHWPTRQGHTRYFVILAVLSLGAGVLLLARVRRIERLLATAPEKPPA